MVEVKHNKSKYAQCNSCLACNNNVYELLVGKYSNCRISISLCKDCMKSMVKQFESIDSVKVTE